MINEAYPKPDEDITLAELKDAGEMQPIECPENISGAHQGNAAGAPPVSEVHQPRFLNCK